MRGERGRIVWGLALSLLLPVAAAAQQGSVQGRVTDEATHAPIPNAQVSIVGTTRGALTDSKGEYRIGSVAPGTIRVRAAIIGFAPMTQSVTVQDNEPATADFALTARAVTLDETVILASGATERVRESGVLTGQLNVDSINLAPVHDASQMLESRVPGVVVTPSSGTAGGNSRIRIRGSNSLSLSNDPLIIIDGVRVNGDEMSSTIGVGGQVPSRLNDLDPEEIASIEVVKGPAAASLYGTAAANGVIYITTKHGRSGEAHWKLHAETGPTKMETVFPANFHAIQVAAGDTTSCSDVGAALGGCSQTGMLSWSPLMQASPFQAGYTQNYGVSVNGGTDRATYYVSGNWSDEKGVLPWNRIRHADFRANVSAQPRDNMNLTASVGYMQSRLRLPQNDNNSLGVLAGLLGDYRNDPAQGYYAGFTPQNISSINTQQNVDRFTGAMNGNWKVFPWLNLLMTTGLDFTDRVDQELVPPNTIQLPSLLPGQRTLNPYQFFNYTVNGGASATFQLLPDLQSTTAAGVQYNNRTVHGANAFGEYLLSGTGSLNGATSLFSVGEVNTGDITLGAYARQQLGWRDRVFLDAAVRGDKNSAFGQNFKEVYYPSASVSWVIGEEPFFPKTSYLSSLRLRAAWGQSGEQPGFRDAITYYSPVAVAVPAGDAVGFTVGGVGNASLKPERSTEVETGFDVGLFQERASISLTYYNKHTTDALVSVPLAPSNGQARTIWRNLGQMRNTGFELLINANLLNREPVQWSVNINASTNDNKVVDLGNGITPIIFGDQRHVNGYPAGGYWTKPLSWKDANGDGLLTPSEVTVGDTAVYDGTPYAKREVSLTSNLTLFKYFRLTGLLDYQGGQKLLNLTEAFRCKLNKCAGAQVGTASLAAQAAAIGTSRLGTDAGYIQDASFWKLREVSLTFLAPRRIASRVGASDLSLTLSGRNLATWTKYPGFDPELSSAATSAYTARDFLTLPPVRYYTVRVDVTW